MADTKLLDLVNDLQTKEQGLSDASATNDTAQAAAQAAVANAASTLQEKNAAHDALSGSIDALVEYAQSLKAI